LKALSIGCLAEEILKKRLEAIVYGSNSQGIFLNTTENWLLYLSKERFRGPLTINLQESQINTLSSIRIGDTANLSAQTLNFPRKGCKIQLEENLVWRPSKAELKVKFLEENRDAARNSLQKWKQKNAKQRKDQQRYAIPNSMLEQVRQAFNHQDIHLLKTALISLLGYGIGLTPSGDDFVFGLLLRLNRCGDVWIKGVNLESLNRWVVEQAANHTSLLSANLIECATMGLADERLIAALDWLVRGEVEDLHAIEGLLGWGHSSGEAVLEGFLFVG
jgi:hypothetical protein